MQIIEPRLKKNYFNVTEQLNNSNIEKSDQKFVFLKHKITNRNFLSQVLALTSLSQNCTSHPFTFCFQKTSKPNPDFQLKSLFSVKYANKMITAGLLLVTNLQ